MRALLSLACASLLTLQQIHSQEISGADSLRDRSRILQKKNPVSSETSGFSSFNGLTANGDAEGVNSTDYLWATSAADKASGSISFLSSFNSLSNNLGYGSSIKASYPLDDQGKSGVSIEIGRNDYDQRFDTLQFLWDSSENEATGLLLPNTARFDVRNLDSRAEHARIIAQTMIANTRFYVVGSHNIIDELDERLRLEYKPSGDVTADEKNVTFESNRIRNSLRKSPDIRIETVYGFGIERESDDLSIRTGGLIRDWQRLRPNTFTIQFQDRERPPLTIDLQDERKPSALRSTADEDPSRYDFLEIRFEDKNTSDSDDVAYFDLDRTGSLQNVSYKLSTGSIYREKTRDNFEIRENYDSYQEPYRLDAAQNPSPVGSFLDGAYQLGNFPSETSILAHFEQNKSGYVFNQNSSDQDSLSQNYNSYERVLGGYLNLLLEYNSWNLSTGFRHEKTKINTFGYEVIANEDGSIEVSPEYGEQDYSHTFPTLSLSYQLPNSTATLSRQKTIARPDYYDLIPYQIIARSSEVVSSGNPDLSPTILDTLSFSWEKQLAKDSSLRIGVSTIDIQDFIYETEETIKQGTYEGFKFRSKFNGSHATIDGIDLSLSKAFEPAFLKGKNVNVRLLHQYRESSAYTENASFSQTILPLVAKNKSRLSLEQTIGQFYWLIQFDYTDKTLDQFGPILSAFEYLDQRLTANARFMYKIDQNWKAQVDIINIGSAPTYETIGDFDRVGKTTIDSWQSRLNISRSW